MKKRVLLISLCLLLVCLPALADVPSAAEQGTCVNDFAEILSEADARHIDSMGKLLEDAYGIQVTAVLVVGLDGMTPDAYAHRLNTQWQRPTERSVLLLISVSDQDASVWPSEDLAWVLEPSDMERLLEERFWPAYRDGRASEGIREVYVNLCGGLSEYGATLPPEEEPPQHWADAVRDWAQEMAKEAERAGQVIAEESKVLAEELAEASVKWWDAVKSAFE